MAGSGLGTDLEQHRRELTAHCYRMLGSAFEAEDAQETMVRAWRGLESFEGRSSLRSWLYRIATNICLDMAGAGQRRARPMDLTSPGTATSAVDAGLPETTWIGPAPDAMLLSADPAIRRSRASRCGWRSSPRCSACPPGSAPC